jgi:hypothetical protein
MISNRLVVAFFAVVAFSAGAGGLLASPEPQEPPAATAVPPALAAWKPFQEFNFALGSWNGLSENGKRVGGAAAQITADQEGNYVTLRGMRLFPQQEGRPEETVEETGMFFYDRDKRRYVAHFYFSSGVVGIYDVEAGDGSLKLTSRELLNYEGARSRITIARSADGLSYLMDLAPRGQEFLPIYATKLSRK